MRNAASKAETGSVHTLRVVSPYASSAQSLGVEDRLLPGQLVPLSTLLE